MTTRTTTGTMPLTTHSSGALLSYFKKDLVFTSSMILALASCFFVQPQSGYIDFKVLACLFNIMIVVKAFEELHLLERMSVGILNGCSDSRRVSLVLILMSFFSSMIFTNDVALLTLVPLTLVISRKSGPRYDAHCYYADLGCQYWQQLDTYGKPAESLPIFL